jgi:hypothetical protein
VFRLKRQLKSMRDITKTEFIPKSRIQNQQKFEQEQILNVLTVRKLLNSIQIP